MKNLPIILVGMMIFVLVAGGMAWEIIKVLAVLKYLFS